MGASETNPTLSQDIKQLYYISGRLPKYRKVKVVMIPQLLFHAHPHRNKTDPEE